METCSAGVEETLPVRPSGSNSPEKRESNTRAYVKKKLPSLTSATATEWEPQNARGGSWCGGRTGGRKGAWSALPRAQGEHHYLEKKVKLLLRPLLLVVTPRVLSAARSECCLSCGTAGYSGYSIRAFRVYRDFSY